MKTVHLKDTGCEKRGYESHQKGMRKMKANKANKIALPIAKEETSACLLLHYSLKGMKHQIRLFIPFSIIGNCVGNMLEREQNRSRDEEKQRAINARVNRQSEKEAKRTL